ncbi:serine threonine protein kinase [Ophiostoma piceae UAMH 11346]|uniref:Serine threonine protein kinase n=1 Tax=Ophiostoma piceae (strain UAMH 11346) TaxID=1262450 RepID=S3CU14_OPHP1|nr:serine threonine protein kinase [Ophiostoma piceae UAMH 11346]
MQTGKGKAEAMGRKAKLAHSYQQLLDEFSHKDLKSVGNYNLGRLIGKGSFGKVYLATHKLINGSKVVLKSAKKDDSNLAREIHHHRQFVHPHIARLYEVIVTESLVWLVLEYCQGDELYNYLLKHGKLPVDKVQRIFAQLAGAVSYVHMQSCVHRDLKLENILLDKHENVKLVDFGFTREYEGKSNYLQTFCGTICYSAPEMLKGEKYAGEKVDVWSLGVILYALLCGELPFDDDDDDVTRRNILTSDPKYPDHIPEDAQSLIKSMLSKRPLLRPTLPDILNHPFLSEHAPQQQAILKLQQPSPFSTSVEKDTLERMHSAGVDIDSVIESVLSQRCDALAGWWTLLIEKEQRKLARRERKRKEKELEHRSSRRLSTTSSRLERLATVDEAGSSYLKLGDPPTPKSRGRTQRRSGHYDGLRIDDFPGLAELSRVNDAFRVANAALENNASNSYNYSNNNSRPPPVDKDSVRSASSSRQRRPIPPPKEGVLRSARSRGSTLHLVTTTDALAAATAAGGGGRLSSNGMGGSSHNGDGGSIGTGPGHGQKVRKKTSQVIITHWKQMTHWIAESTRRSKHAGKRGSHSTPNLLKPSSSSHKSGKDENSPRPQTSKYPASASGAGVGSSSGSNTASLPKGVVANGYGSKGGSGGSSGGGSGSGGAHASNSRDIPPLPPLGSLGIIGGQAGGSGSGSGSGSGTGAGAAQGGLGPGIVLTGLGSGNSSAVVSGSSNGNSPLSPNTYYQYYSQQPQSQNQTQQQQPQSQRLQSGGSYKRHSLSPSPLTPRSSTAGNSGRRPSASGNLRGRKSTSSSVSSIRSMHHPGHHHSHSKASSTSSNGSVSTSMSKTPGATIPGRSPHHSVKVLPATPTATSFPSNLRLGMPLGRTPGSPNPFGGNPVMFAKRKRNIFKGPMLSFGSAPSAGASRGHSHSRSASASGLGRRSGEITIEEEEEEEEMDDDDDDDDNTISRFMLEDGGGGVGGLDDVEEVDSFSPVIRRPGEQVEEIYEDERGVKV